MHEGATGSYLVGLGSQPTGSVTVTASVASSDLTIAPDRLVFTPSMWRVAQEVTISAARDADAVADAPVQINHSARGGGYDGILAGSVWVTIVEADVATLAADPATASEQAGTMRFTVTLSSASDRVLTVDYATGAAADTAAEDRTTPAPLAS